MWTTKQALEKKKKTHLQEWVMSMKCIHGYTVYEKRMYVCLYWLWSTDYVQMCEILWNKYSFIHSNPPMVNTLFWYNFQLELLCQLIELE